MRQITELLLLIAGAAVGLGILYLIWRGLRGLGVPDLGGRERGAPRVYR